MVSTLFNWEGGAAHVENHIEKNGVLDDMLL